MTKENYERSILIEPELGKSYENPNGLIIRCKPDYKTVYGTLLGCTEKYSPEYYEKVAKKLIEKCKPGGIVTIICPILTEENFNTHSDSFSVLRVGIEYDVEEFMKL